MVTRDPLFMCKELDHLPQAIRHSADDMGKMGVSDLKRWR